MFVRRQFFTPVLRLAPSSASALSAGWFALCSRVFHRALGAGGRSLDSPLDSRAFRLLAARGNRLLEGVCLGR